ncbi:MAG: ABC transporter ATP-binding protein [Mesorhizobium sp.]|nr:ABC transporter ATP-binding protein [Mesorhizobium sp.]MBN9245524.1 ABC transporter ATP-binding protein [Mesorhizobium sp.]
MSKVDIRNVSKRYGDVIALNDVSLSFGEREFFGLLGPSGSGKTTLLRSIAGFVEPTSGEILIEGGDISRIPTYKRDIGMVFQNYALFPHMTIFENVAFPLSVRGVKDAEIRSRVANILELVQLGAYGSRRPRELSGGQQQRIALARALVSRPRVLLLDEPLGALDKNLRQQMQIELRQIQREVGITTILVTHDQEEALTLSDRIAIFRKGEVVQTGRPDEIYERPQNAFAAEFFGATNFLEGHSAGNNGGLGSVRLDDGTLVLTSDVVPANGERVVTTVRPEKFRISAAKAALPEDGQPVNVLSGTVVRPVYIGASVTYHVTTGTSELTVFQQNREARLFETGDRVVLNWLPQHAVVLAG